MAKIEKLDTPANIHSILHRIIGLYHLIEDLTIRVNDLEIQLREMTQNEQA